MTDPDRGRPHPVRALACDDHDEQFIRMLIHLALEGEQITGAFEEGGTVTSADDDPYHVPLPAEVPMPRPEPPGALPAEVPPTSASTPAEADASASADETVDDPVDGVDAQVSAPEVVKAPAQGSGAEPAAPPPPTAPPTSTDWWRTAPRGARTEPRTAGAVRDARPGWWDRLYRDQNADLDTHTGHILTVPADGGPVLIQVQKSDSSDGPGPGDEHDDAAATRPQSVGEPRPQPTLRARPEPVLRWRPSRFWRVLTFNGTAAAAGSVIGLNTYLSQFPPAATAAASGLIGAGLALAGGFTAWKVAGSELLAPYVPFGRWGRLGTVFFTAELGRRLGEEFLPYTSGAIARHTGLTQADVSLLIVGLTLCGASGWLVWRTREGGLLKRWLARVPLATSLLVCALYTNGPVI
ncbi:hypothetical protein [Streptomyces sp. CAU 1734]|uniref:hypothetical protein n=1 Tax=Streptomyces sp. CAU 1734 TaxID=3140360 RepID=UPI003260BBC8